MTNKGITFYDKDFCKFSEGSELIKESIKRILMTRPGERVNNLSFGSRLQEYLFSNSGVAVEDILTEVKSSIERNDYRVIVNGVTLEKKDDDTVYITLNVTERVSGSVLSIGVIV